jgi:hypothetical protein
MQFLFKSTLREYSLKGLCFELSNIYIVHLVRFGRALRPFAERTCLFRLINTENEALRVRFGGHRSSLYTVITPGETNDIWRISTKNSSLGKISEPIKRRVSKKKNHQ